MTRGIFVSMETTTMIRGICCSKGGGAVACMFLEEESNSSKEEFNCPAPAVAAIGISKASEDGGVGSSLSDLSSLLLSNGSERRRRRTHTARSFL